MLQHTVDEYLAILASDNDEGESRHHNTIIAYRNDLRQLCLYLEEKGFTQWSHVTHEIIALYLLEMHEGQHYRPATIVRKLAAFKSFFRYLVSTGLIEENPVEDLEAPPIHKEPPHVLDKEEIARLFAQIPHETPVGLRDNAMLQMLYATGMRVSELVALNLDDFNALHATIHCIGRSGQTKRERLLPLSEKAVEATLHYLRAGRVALVRRDDEPALFVNHHGERLTRQGFWLIIKGYARQAGIDDITPHMMRHSFATIMLKDGMELRSVQELLGHVHLSTMYIYSQIVQTEVIDE